MSQYRTEEDVRNYDIFKGIVTALLLITLFIMAALGYGVADEVASTGYPADEVASGTEEGMDNESAGLPDGAEIAAPDLLSPAPGSALETGPQTFSGMGMVGSQVALIAGGSELGRTLVAPSGTWEIEASLPTGTETIVLKSLDSGGNVLAASDPIPMTSGPKTDDETGLPTAESESAEPGILPTVDLPAEEVIDSQPFTLTGTGEPGASLRLLANGADLGTVTVAEDGTWSLETSLPQGDYEIDVDILDANGDVQNTVPAISVPVSPPAGPRFIMPELSIPDFNPLSGVFTWDGESTPGSRVAAIVDEQVVEETTTDPQGRWRLILPLAAGAHTLAFGQVDEEGNVTSSSDPITIEIPDRLPQLDLPDEAVAADQNVMAPPQVTIPAGTVELTGTAEPGQEVALIVNGQVSATAVVDGDGNFTLPADLSDGTYTIQLGVIGDDGTLAAKSIEVNVSTGEAVAEAPAGETPAPEATAEPAAGESATPAAEAEENQVPGVSGTITYEEEVELPGDAVFTVQIINISQADAAAQVLAEQVIEAEDRQVPIPYKVPYDPAEVDENLQYGVTARIESNDGTLLFISDTNLPVITNNNPTEDVEIVTVQVENALADAELGVGDSGLSEGAGTVLEAMQNSGQFTILLDGLEAAGLTDRLAQTGTAYTFFAPTDEAFEALPPGVLAGWTFNPQEFAAILRNTVVEGLYTPGDLTNGLVLRSLDASNIGVQHIGELITVNGIPAVDATEAGESYVYALPQVILPPLSAGVTAPAIDVAGVPIFIGDWLTVVGVGQPGERIVLTMDGAQFGEIATVDDNHFWLVEGDIGPGIHNITAYMIGSNGLVQAISNEVTLAVPES